jgi:hypothetical protein
MPADRRNRAAFSGPGLPLEEEEEESVFPMENMVLRESTMLIMERLL